MHLYGINPTQGIISSPFPSFLLFLTEFFGDKVEDRRENTNYLHLYTLSKCIVSFSWLKQYALNRLTYEEKRFILLVVLKVQGHDICIGSGHSMVDSNIRSKCIEMIISQTEGQREMMLQ
jgi:hypothetical protein